MKLVDVSDVLAKYHSGKCSAEKVIDEPPKPCGTALQTNVTPRNTARGL